MENTMNDEAEPVSMSEKDKEMMRSSGIPRRGFLKWMGAAAVALGASGPINTIRAASEAIGVGKPGAPADVVPETPVSLEQQEQTKPTTNTFAIYELQPEETVNFQIQTGRTPTPTPLSATEKPPVIISPPATKNPDGSFKGVLAANPGSALDEVINGNTDYSLTGEVVEGNVKQVTKLQNVRCYRDIFTAGRGHFGYADFGGRNVAMWFELDEKTTLNVNFQKTDIATGKVINDNVVPYEFPAGTLFMLNRDTGKIVYIQPTEPALGAPVVLQVDNTVSVAAGKKGIDAPVGTLAMGVMTADNKLTRLATSKGVAELDKENIPVNRVVYSGEESAPAVDPRAELVASLGIDTLTTEEATLYADKNDKVVRKGHGYTFGVEVKQGQKPVQGVLWVEDGLMDEVPMENAPKNLGALIQALQPPIPDQTTKIIWRVKKLNNMSTDFKSNQFLRGLEGGDLVVLRMEKDDELDAVVATTLAKPALISKILKWDKYGDVPQKKQLVASYFLMRPLTAFGKNEQHVDDWGKYVAEQLGLTNDPDKLMSLYQIFNIHKPS